MSEREHRGYSNRPRFGSGGSGGGGGSRAGGPRGNFRGGDRPRPRNEPSYLYKGTVVYVLDILQHGGIDRKNKGGNEDWQPIVQVMQVPSFQFFEVALNRGEVLNIQDRIEITGEKGPLGRIVRHMKFEELTPTSKDIIQDVMMQYVVDNEAEFIRFLNNAGPITIKRHTLEVLPGIGKKIMWDIVNERQKTAFTDFANFKARVPGVKIEETIAKRIIEELSNLDEKHYLFVKRGKPNPSPATSPRPQHQY